MAEEITEIKPEELPTGAGLLNKPKTVKKEVYEMPLPEIGQRVWWWYGPDAGAEPLMADVTAIGHRAVTLGVLHPNAHNFDPYDGVRHVSDPQARMQDADVGVWDFTDRDKMQGRVFAYFRKQLR
jgi:hypothetical protein